MNGTPSTDSASSPPQCRPTRWSATLGVDVRLVEVLGPVVLGGNGKRGGRATGISLAVFRCEGRGHDAAFDCRCDLVDGTGLEQVDVHARAPLSLDALLQGGKISLAFDEVQVTALDEAGGCCQFVV